MLKGIDTRLGADVLHALHSMGHGDMLVLVDTNFPADSVARATHTGRALAMPNLTSAEAVEAVLTLLPLDTFVDDFAARMEVVDAPGEIPEVQREVQQAIDAAEGRSRPMTGVERFAFYDMAKTAHTVIRTGERRFYGCFMLRKGVIAPDAQ
ncbi:RbsD/FucU family protein [Oceaniglobus roseus]|uniref:RbsD/FucU family protein n=1 Tax=Oceaniglobus roseus TaxID=1737570 RepID=UPI000C7F03ED|nr:RbsD/FucU domain-containing protein [Kandeliimicrobium roseum]